MTDTLIPPAHHWSGKRLEITITDPVTGEKHFVKWCDWFAIYVFDAADGPVLLAGDGPEPDLDMVRQMMASRSVRQMESQS